MGGRLDFDAAGNLVAVDLASDRVSLTDADIPCLLALPHLTRLRLSGGGITNVGLRQVASIAGLDDLFLLDAQVDDAGLTRLAQLKNLRSLTIRRSPQLSDKGLECLKRLPKLVDLGLLEVGITNRGLERLKDLPQLRALDLRGSSQIDNTGLEQLRALKKLRTLRLGGYQTNDDAMAIVGRLSSLACLTIDEAAVSDGGMARLIGLPLEEISISRCYGITDDGFRHLGNIATLRRISVRGVPLTGGGLTHLLQLSPTGRATVERDGC